MSHINIHLFKVKIEGKKNLIKGAQKTRIFKSLHSSPTVRFQQHQNASIVPIAEIRLIETFYLMALNLV